MGYCIINSIYCTCANGNGYCVNTACRNPKIINKYIEVPHTQYIKIEPRGEWKLEFADFNDGAGLREYPHCTSCFKAVYPRDAGKYCTFCGAIMKNPLVE